MLSVVIEFQDKDGPVDIRSFNASSVKDALTTAIKHCMDFGDYHIAGTTWTNIKLSITRKDL